MNDNNFDYFNIIFIRMKTIKIYNWILRYVIKKKML